MIIELASTRLSDHVKRDFKNGDKEIDIMSLFMSLREQTETSKKALHELEQSMKGDKRNEQTGV